MNQSIHCVRVKQTRLDQVRRGTARRMIAGVSRQWAIQISKLDSFNLCGVEPNRFRMNRLGGAQRPRNTQGTQARAIPSRISDQRGLRVVCAERRSRYFESIEGWRDTVVVIVRARGVRM